MSDARKCIGDEMIETQLVGYSNKLNISFEALIERYIRRGLFMDDYYVATPITLEEWKEISRKNVEEDMKRGIMPAKNDFSWMIGIMNNDD